MLLSLALCLSTLFFLASAFVFFLLNPNLKNAEKNKSFLEKLPRNRIFGGVFAWIALLWCYPNIVPLFDPSSSLQDAIIPFLVVVAVIVSFFADFLFARAFAAVLILDAHALLKWMYPLNPPAYAVFAFFTMLFGTLGILLAAKPYWLRDWFRTAYSRKRIRILSEAFFLVLAAMMLLFLVEIHV